MAGMAGIYVGASGLRAAQEALNTTAHNLSNINTSGYTRQQIGYSTAKYFTIGQNALGSLSYGIGVNISEIRRVRDDFLDRSYRTENGRAAFYESQYEAVEEVESLFGELHGVSFASSLDELLQAFNEVAKNPGSTVTRTALVQSASAFLSRATSIYEGLLSYQDTLNTKIKKSVARINELGNTINNLNQQISYIESNGESANDYRDQRDAALDELASLIDIDYQELPNGRVEVVAEGITFVTGSTVYEIGTQNIEGTSLLTPVWPQYDNREVFVVYAEYNSINSNDIGELKGLLLARGDRRTNYTDIPVMPERENYQNDAEYEQAMTQYNIDSAYYNKYIDTSVITSTMAGFDRLINGMVEKINDVFCPETTVTADDGTEYTILDTDKASYGMDGTTTGVEFFSRKYTERYQQQTITVNGQLMSVYVRNNTNTFGNTSLYTLGNLEINDKILQDVQNITLNKKNGEEDFATAEELVTIWDEEFASLNPSKYGKETFQEYYNSLTSYVGNNGQVLYNMTEDQQAMAAELENKRQEKLGVASDDELTSMIRYQNAYNAASRYVTAVSEMLEHLVTSLGR